MNHDTSEILLGKGRRNNITQHPARRKPCTIRRSPTTQSAFKIKKLGGCSMGQIKLYRENSEKTAAFKAFRVAYYLGLPPVTKIPLPKKTPDRKMRAATSTETVKDRVNKYGEERGKLKSRKGFYSIKETNQRGATWKEKEQEKNCLEKKIASFIKKYHCWPAALCTRGNI